MKLVAIFIKNHATVYGGAQQLRQAVLFVFMGNPTTYKGNTFVWKQGRKLVSGTLNGKNFSYAYDGNGMRYEKKVNGVKTNYYYDGSQLLMESKNGSRIWYIYGVTGIEGMIVESGWQESVYYFDKNTLGDIIAIRDESGNIVARYEYDAWGNITYQSGSMANINPFRYRGYYYDTETGFYYLQTRYYDPTICRFINADNYELVATLSTVPGQLNMYAYANNNPIMYTDATGEAFFLTALLVGFAIGMGTSIVTQGMTNGWNNVNYLQAGIDGAFGALSVGLAATGIGLGASMAFGAGIGVTQYSVSSLAFGGEFSLERVLLSGTLGTLGGFISGAGAQNAKGLANAILGNTSATAAGMISGIRALTGNTAFSNVVAQEFARAVFKINLTTVGTPIVNGLRNLYVVD